MIRQSTKRTHTVQITDEGKINPRCSNNRCSSISLMARNRFVVKKTTCLFIYERVCLFVYVGVFVCVYVCFTHSITAAQIMVVIIHFTNRGKHVNASEHRDHVYDGLCCLSLFQNERFIAL